MAERHRGPGAAFASLVVALIDLVLPAECAGCAAGDGSPMLAIHGVCARCVQLLATRPVPATPVLAPPGLPTCFTGGPYQTVRRELILAYKERGRRGLAAPLGDALAAVVSAGLAASASAGPGALVLVPVPATAAAVRARHGDHMLRLARRAARVLGAGGWYPTVATPLRARRKADSAELDRRGRAIAARTGFVVRPARARAVRAAATAGAAVVLLDDIITTGSTLAAVAGRLAEEAVPVAFAATLAATQLRHRPGGPGTGPGWPAGAIDVHPPGPRGG